MKKLIPFIMLALAAPMSARADITHKLSSSVQLQVNAAATQVERIGSSFSITGNGVDTTDGNTAATIKDLLTNDYLDPCSRSCTISKRYVAMELT